jgi:hypothetical protein
MGPRGQEFKASSCTEIAGRSPTDEESTLLSSTGSTSGWAKRSAAGFELLHLLVQAICGRVVLITLVLVLGTAVLFQRIDLEDTTRTSSYDQGGEPDAILQLKTSSAGKSTRRRDKCDGRRL